jgi:hypothetical protein
MKFKPVIQELTPEAILVLKELHGLLAKEFGITMKKDQIYLSWKPKTPDLKTGDHSCQVRLEVQEIFTPSDDKKLQQEEEERERRITYLQETIKRDGKNFDLKDALSYLEEGEWPQ